MKKRHSAFYGKVCNSQLKGWRQKLRKTVVVAFLGKMAAHLDCVADELIMAGQASITVTYVLIKTVALLKFLTLSGSSVVASCRHSLRRSTCT